MKITLCKKWERGLTLVDLLVVMVVFAVVAILACILIPVLPHGHGARPGRIQCVNNLKQIAMATRVWEADHGDKYPWNVSATNGGTMEFTSGPNLWRHFQVMSNELSTPKVLICTAESDRMRKGATNFTAFSNSNLSYFINLDAPETDPQSILFGDHNITNGTPVRNGILKTTTNQPAGWTGEMHNKVGNLTLSDGSVQQVSGSGLRGAIGNTSAITNRLFMPILGP